MTRLSDTIPLQVTIGSAQGVNVQSLIYAIQAGYQDPDGHHVEVHIGTGVDGLTPGMILLEAQP